MKKRWDILIVTIGMTLIFLFFVVGIFVVMQKKMDENPIEVEQMESLQEEPQKEEAEGVEETEIVGDKQDMTDSDTQNEIEDIYPENVADEVVIQYQDGEEAALEILKQQEESLSAFLLRIFSGNGVAEDTESLKKEIHQVSIKEVSDQGTYLFFTGVLDGTDVPMIYYKDADIFAMREENTQPGRTNAYEEIE